MGIVSGILVASDQCFHATGADATSLSPSALSALSVTTSWRGLIMLMVHKMRLQSWSGD